MTKTQGRLWKDEELDGQLELRRDLRIYGHVCPHCSCPVTAGERDAEGTWTCRECGRLQSEPRRVPVEGR